jgi:hypothetical protein
MRCIFEVRCTIVYALEISWVYVRICPHLCRYINRNRNCPDLTPMSCHSLTWACFAHGSQQSVRTKDVEIFLRIYTLLERILFEVISRWWQLATSSSYATLPLQEDIIANVVNVSCPLCQAVTKPPASLHKTWVGTMVHFLGRSKLC